MIDTETAAVAVKNLLAAFGVDEGDHTAETPARVARMWGDLLAGYTEDPAVHLRKTFSAPERPGAVIVSGIALRSTCAHHLLPFTGTATVAYMPRSGAPVVGLSKLARVVHGYARRLQVQERIGAQVVDALESELNPVWAACVITAGHDCMRLRGVREHEARTTTVASYSPGGGHGDWLDRVLAEHNR